MAEFDGVKTVVLVVEDDAHILRLIMTIVEHVCGLAAVGARSGAEALASAATFRGRLAAAVLDVGLPDTTGPALLERLRGELGLPGLAAVYVSAKAPEDWATRGVDLDPADVLAKPFAIGRFREALSHATRRPPG